MGGDFDQRGILNRCHVRALAFQPTGKEADQIEEREVLGEDEGPLERLHSQQQHRKSYGPAHEAGMFVTHGGDCVFVAPGAATKLAMMSAPPSKCFSDFSIGVADDLRGSAL